MNTIEDLSPASFRNIPFLVNSEQELGGKKTVTHEFVGSDKRFTEDSLGLLPPTFTIEAIVQDPDAITKRINLINALNQSGLGVLVHPVYGAVNVKSTIYTINSNQRGIGEFRFSIPFERSEAVVTAAVAPATFSAVQNSAENSRTKLGDAFENAFVSPILPEELTETAEKAESIYDEVLEVSKSALNVIQSKVATFTSFVSDSKADVLTIVQIPFSMKNNLESLYSSALDIVNTPGDLYDMWNRLIDFGFLDIRLPIITESRRISEGNKSVLNEHTRIEALINSYEAGADREYETTDEIATTREELNAAHERIMEEYDDDIDTDNVPVLAEDPDLRTAIADLRTNAEQILNEKEQNAWRVIQVDPGRSSMALTAYRYYGNIDNLDIVRELNPNANHADFDETINAISR